MLGTPLILMLRGLVGASPRWIGCQPLPTTRIYFANHTSHMDTLAIIAALPQEARLNVKPVAAADYWGKNAFLSYISKKGLNAVLIERKPDAGKSALEPIFDVLHAGHSIIFFPEGTRSCQALPGDFKSGLFRLSETFPDVDLVPVYLENLHRSMPKGKHFPLPIICTIRIGNPLPTIAGEEKQLFLERARDAIVRLSK